MKETKTTVKDLLDAIRLTNSAKDESCKMYVQRIEDMLKGFPEDTEIRNRKSVNEFIQPLSMLDDAKRDYCNELNIMCTVIDDWVDAQKKKKVTISKQEKKSKKMLIIIAILFSVTAAAAIVLTILSVTKQFAHSNELSLTMDCLGLATGLWFFLYERLDDRKKRKLEIELDAAVNELQETNGNMSPLIDNHGSIASPIVKGSKNVNITYNGSLRDE